MVAQIVACGKSLYQLGSSWVMFEVICGFGGALEFLMIPQGILKKSLRSLRRLKRALGNYVIFV